MDMVLIFAFVLKKARVTIEARIVVLGKMRKKIYRSNDRGTGDVSVAKVWFNFMTRNFKSLS